MANTITSNLETTMNGEVDLERAESHMDKPTEGPEGDTAEADGEAGDSPTKDDDSPNKDT